MIVVVKIQARVASKYTLAASAKVNSDVLPIPAPANVLALFSALVPVWGTTTSIAIVDHIG